MYKLLIVLVFFGCAGKTRYEITTPDGISVRVTNTKDYKSYEMQAEKTGEGTWKIKIIEEGVSASDPMIAAQQRNDQFIKTLLNTITGIE